MEKQELEFSVDTASLLNEIFDNALMENMGVLKVPINVFRNLLCQVSKRAIELNDPKLHILMLKLNLYEVNQNERIDIIENLEEQLKKGL